MLALIFFVIALIYSMVGFGGGSSYLALLSQTNISFIVIPTLALICNIIVVTRNSFGFYRKGIIPFDLLKPLLFTSVPMSLVGALYPIGEKTYFILLGLTLFIAGIFLLIKPTIIKNDPWKKKYLALIGAILGFISGMVGIGGGIFLAPFLLLTSQTEPKKVAACSTFFILYNSVAGLIGQIFKNGLLNVFDFYPLFLAVLLGGSLGIKLSLHPRFSQLWVQRMTALLILWVSVRLLLEKW